MIHSSSGRLLKGTISLLFIAILAACKPAFFNPPRLTSSPAQLGPEAVSTSEPLFLPAPTAISGAGSSSSPIVSAGANPTLTVWINESSDQHRQALQQMVDEFEQRYPINVELYLVSSGLLPSLMETAILSDTVPDIVLHPAAYTVGWTQRGILDPVAADAIIDQIGRSSFDPAALNLVEVDGITAAIPSDGYHQLLIYRKDWFDELGLAAPTDYASMMTAAETVHDAEALNSGIVVPTESNLVTTHQVFEQIAAANGCQLIDRKGEVLLLEPACREAIDFYQSIINRFSPVGVQTDTSTRNAYLAGTTGFIIGTPRMLPKLAGLDQAVAPSCPECVDDPGYLAEASGIITTLKGVNASAPAASYGEVTYLGITRAADSELATAFVDYWFNDGYPIWLATEAERKVPMRWGTNDEPGLFIDRWGSQPVGGSNLTLTDIYGQPLVDQLKEGIADSQRWGFPQGQGALIGTMYQELTLPVVLQEMLSGYFNSGQTLVEMYRRITDLIPNYEYYSDTESGTN